MTTLSSIGRPYAEAAFRYANEHHQLAEWKSFLDTAALILDHKDAVKAITRPDTEAKTLVAFFESMLSSLLDTGRKNFIALLAENKRLIALPAIAKQYNALLAREANIGSARLTTAVEVDDAYRQTLTAALSKRTQRQISLTCHVDPAILGGAIIHLDDHVIDGSLRGKLARLLEFSLR